MPAGSHVEIWLFDGPRPVRRLRSLSQALVDDAGRHGQDLLDEVVSDLLRGIEGGIVPRHSAVPAATRSRGLARRS